MPPVGFEPTISAGKRQQTYALDLAPLGPAFRVYSNFNTGVLREKLFFVCYIKYKIPIKKVG
jgi:hypothetical protein